MRTGSVRRATRRVLWALLLCLTVGGVASAQDGIAISGVVTTRADGLAVPGAVVSIVGLDATATTDAGGRYTLTLSRSAVRDGRIRVKVDALGLPPTVTDVVVDAPAVTVDFGSLMKPAFCHFDGYQSPT